MPFTAGVRRESSLLGAHAAVVCAHGRDECRVHVDGYAGSVYKSFLTREDAEQFVTNGPAGGPYSVRVPRKTDAVTVKGAAAALEENVLSGATHPENAAIRVYTDGSTLNNGRTGAVAGYGVYWENEEHRHANVSRRLAGTLQTNNRAELRAIIAAVEECPEPDRPLYILTDSKYAIEGTYSVRVLLTRSGYKMGAERASLRRPR